jgi:hypothetical protein
METDNIEFEGSLQTYYTEFSEEVKIKFDEFKLKLNKQKEELKTAFRAKLFEIQDMSSEVKETQRNIGNNTEGRTKEQIIEEAKTIKNQIESLIKKMETIENYAASLKDKNIHELINIKENDFCFILDLGFEKSSSENNAEKFESEESPAGKPLSNSCKTCRKILKWGAHSYSSTCTSSNICNTHYKYECNSCSVRFCTNCAYPPNIDTCGCGKTLSYISAAYHCCDLCRASISSNCYRCVSCDYDVCDQCYSKHKFK